MMFIGGIVVGILVMVGVWFALLENLPESEQERFEQARRELREKFTEALKKL